ncbi:hypothetical protein AXJ11_gp08 [Gordonia phage GordDuk1]|uniref:Uncharacterized protein n=1 Tax=Gordonia phage GordDuk1 TaxID=1622191 RepID=A0A0E3T601_9CAUD|nr:hypothetical protein AXJ11_gp08 [Gordonia phage GordDuk1]AKC02936.1 hypothetical protein GordDuk1_8 [Gordonia phage GordDuk1]
MAVKPDGSVTKPSGPVVPGGSAKPAVSPGNTKPNEVGKSNSPLLPGTPEFLIKDAVGPDEVFNQDGYLGVDPVYQNGATANERPIPPEEPEPEPEP